MVGTVAAVSATAAAIESILAEQPDVRRDLVSAYEAAREAIDPDLFDKVRIRVAMLLGCSAELADDPTGLAAILPSWPTSPAFSARDRACLAYAEQFVVDVASMPDHLVEDVTRELGDTALIDFTHALLTIEQRQRLTLTWARLFEGAV
jgi:alkylhydroperoxidase family enzyme